MIPDRLREPAAAAVLALGLLLLANPRAVAQERPAATGIQTRLAAVVRKIGAYQQKLSWEAKTRDARLASVRLRLQKIRLLAERYGLYAAEDMLRARIGRELAVAEAHAAALGTPLTGHTRPGRHELAYLSPIDLSPEPLQVYVPTAYDGKQPRPLMIFLHGYDSFLDRVNWIDTMYSPGMEKLAEANGFLVVMPYGRSNTEFMGVGEVEVLNALRFMKKHYRVEERRVLMTGASMGGSGAYSIATHYPHLFSGLMAITGRMDFYLWMGVPKERLPRFKQILADTDYVQNALDNLRHVPVMLFQGAADERPYPQPEQSRRMHRRLRALGYDSTYVEFKDRFHYIWADSFSHPGLGPWVTFGTMTLKYNRAYWVEIAEFIRWGRRATVRAEVTAPDTISLKTTNVARVVLRPGALVAAGQPVTVNVNGVKRAVKPDGAGAYTVDAATMQAPPAGALRKTPALCGPVRDAYCSRFLIVRGTAGTPEETETEKQRARDEAREWVEFTQGRAHVRRDDEVTDEDIRDSNLILIGSPWTNRLTARIAPKLPIRIERRAYVVGNRRVPREGVSLLMIYPNPLNPKRYVVISDGPRWGKWLERNHKLDLVPDFILFRQEPINVAGYAPYVDRIAATNRHVCAGFFDKYWRLSDRLTWWAQAAGG